MGMLKDICEFVSKPLWWLAKRFVDKLAQELAIRQFNLSALVRLYVDQYAHAGKIDRDQARGKAETVAQALLAEIDLRAHEPGGELILKRVKDEVTIACVSLGTWMQLSILQNHGPATPRSRVAVKFRDQQGRTTTALTAVSFLPEQFLFHQATQLDCPSPDQALSATVSKEVVALLRAVLERDAPEVLAWRISEEEINARDL